MSADARNTVTLIGGIVADPELKADGKLAQFRMAVDYAGNDAVNNDNKSGYFTVKYWKDDTNPNSKFVFGQIEAGNLKKGSQGIAIVGRLQDERWESDGQKRSQVTIVAENMTYTGSAPKAAADTAAGTTENVPNW